MYKVKFADIGEGLTSGKVIEVLVKVGDVVKDGDSLFSVETDKVNAEIPAPASGKIHQIFIQPDQEIKVGAVVMEIETGSTTEKTPPPVTKNVSTSKIEENASVVGSTPVSDELITRSANKGLKDKTTKQLKATPLARKMANDLKIDLNQVQPTGPGGRILVKDLEQVKDQSSKSRGSNLNQTAPSFTNSQNPLTFTSKPMNQIRKATVKSMTRSHSEIADFTGIRRIDVTALVDLRQQLKPTAETQGIKLTYLPFIVKATSLVLSEMPNINVQIDEAVQAIKLMKNINLGIAVDTTEGLMVPVVKDANHLSVFEIAVAINDLAVKAKNQKLTLKDVTEATFTITNFGSIGLEYATPIINSPQAAILGVGAMIKTPVYVGETIQPRMLMPFSMTADHRIIDGAEVGRFLQRIEYYLQNPAILLI